MAKDREFRAATPSQNASAGETAWRVIFHRPVEDNAAMKTAPRALFKNHLTGVLYYLLLV